MPLWKDNKMLEELQPHRMKMSSINESFRTDLTSLPSSFHREEGSGTSQGWHIWGCICSAALNHKATFRKSLCNQPYTKLAPNLPYFGPFNSQNISGKINIKTFFVLPDSCTCYVGESLPNSFIQTVSQICRAENLTAKVKDVGGKRHRDVFPGEA